MTYAAAIEIARQKAENSGSPSSTELYRLLARDPEAYSDYLRLRDRIWNGAEGQPALLDVRPGVIPRP